MNDIPDGMSSDEKRLAQVRGYHERTKHRFDRYAEGPGFMDWATQPDPFRRFAGTEQVTLPLAAGRLGASFGQLFAPDDGSPEAVTLETVGILLELSLGLAAWKAYDGDRWALRCNPSSGNLHPTEGYIVAGQGVAGLDAGVYHYQSHDHVLERRCRAALPLQGFLLGLSSVHWREAWKYGERAFRYCQHDVGHALGAVRYAAALLGWKVSVLEEWADADIAHLLGLERDDDFQSAEDEAPDLLLRVGPPGEDCLDIDELAGSAASGEWFGRANVLSRRHAHHWAAIDEVHHATIKPRTVRRQSHLDTIAERLPSVGDQRAADLIWQRRSAQAFDGVTAIPAQTLYRMLDAVLPRTDSPPFDCWPWPPRVHFLLFVHRVVGLAPGVYLFLRNSAVATRLREQVRSEFSWERVDSAPSHLPLYLLVRANCQRAARNVSCHQDIAADSAVSLGMLAEFDAPLAEGAWIYRHLYWECGLIGQALYLEAEAAGVRGTGIGCFFDDAVHELIGLKDSLVQSLYHFTIGGPVNDTRLQTLPPYGHLRR